jgi:N-acetylmuramoyl-L-alanine amidase
MTKSLKIALFLIFITSYCFADAKTGKVNFVTAEPKLGDGITNILSRYFLDSSPSAVKEFIALNKGKFGKKNALLKGIKYKLPIKVFNYDGKSIRSTLGSNDVELANQVKAYNEKCLAAKLQKIHYTKSKQLWVPLVFLSNNDDSDEKEDTSTSIKQPAKAQNNQQKSNQTKTDSKPEGADEYPIFGKKYQKVESKSHALDGCIYYLVSGHGGSDPGAVGFNGSNRMCEDEYAYDVILRLGRTLLEHGATVYFIVNDPNDGIRDEQFLVCDEDEKFYGNRSIPDDQKGRLQRGADIINELYEKNKSTAKLQQSLNIHLDSRKTSKKIDIFFYYQDGCNASKNLAETIYSTIKNKYDAVQPGRGYKGTITTRNLYMLRHTVPTTVYLELGNIQNKPNQVRFIEKNNRQAIANWIALGLIKYVEENL